MRLLEVPRPEEMGKVGDPNYCKYHWMLGHPTKSFYQLNDILQALVDAGALKLRPEQKAILAITTAFLQFGQSPSIPTLVNPIPRAELRIVNIDLHQCHKKG